jgi:L-threonylcarbamoyladenylate synthase
MARVLRADEEGIRVAVAALNNGELIGLPTETVYGLAADATNDDALRKVFAVKGRPEHHPLIVHIALADDLAALADHVPPYASDLARRVWPGPLTLIVRANARVSRLVTGGRDTVAVRCPSHPVAHRVIAALGRPVAAPSANRFGHVSPTSAQHVVDDLGDAIDVVLDGGACEVGVESTIVDCTGEVLEVLRPGAVTLEQLRDVLEGGGPEPDGGTAMRRVVDGTTGESRASGMLASHYAPRARLILHEAGERFEPGSAPVLDFSGDTAAAARLLYVHLRDLDARHVAVAHVILPPAIGMGVALRDRLTKAAAGR